MVRIGRRMRVVRTSADGLFGSLIGFQNHKQNIAAIRDIQQKAKPDRPEKKRDLQTVRSL